MHWFRIMRAHLAVSILLTLLHSSAQQHAVFTGRRTFRTERILIGTVQSLSGNGADTSHLLAGYKLWVERTNLQGGVTVGNSSMEVELKVLDCAGDQARQAEMYQRLVQVDQVDFLLGGGPGSAKAMYDAAESNQILSLSGLDDGEWDQFSESSFMYAVHPTNVLTPTVQFVETSRQHWGLKRMAAIWVASSPRAVAECQSMFAAIQARSVDVEIVLRGSIEGEAPEEYSKVLIDVREAEPDFLVSCVETTEQAQKIVRAARRAMILKGWDGKQTTISADPDNEQCSRIVVPAVVDSAGVKLMYYTAGAANDDFYEQLDGWAQKALGPAVWHHKEEHDDPIFGSAAAVNALWQSRRDLGDGAPMSAETAAGMAAGLVLRLAVEKAASIRGSDVAAAMQGLDQETFFGRVRFGADGSNEGLEMPVVQWDCASEQHCELVVTAPLQSVSAGAMPFAQPFHPPCPPDYILEDKGANQVEYAPAATNDGFALPESYTNPNCVPCMQGNMTKLKALSGAATSWESFLSSCKEFNSVYRYGVALMAGPGDDEGNEGVRRGLNYVKQLSDGLSMMNLAAVPTDPGPDGTSWPEAAKESARQELQSTLALVEETKPLGWIIWNHGFTKQLGVEPLGDVCPGEGPQITWGERAVCIAPAPRLQGRAIAQFVTHFGWVRCHVIVSKGFIYSQMLAEFRAMDALLGFEVMREVEIPEQGAAERADAIEQVASLDDCDAAIVVMFVERVAAEDIFARVNGGDSPGWGGSKRFVVIGSEAATRASNAPRGMLGVRTVGDPEEGPAEGVMAGSGRSFGTGVYVPTEPGVQQPQDAMETLAPWLDHAVEDRRMFAADAALVIAIAAWTLMEGQQNVDVSEPLQVEVGVTGVNELMLEGATGLLLFQVAGDGTPESPRIVERIGGRLAFVNRKASGWVSVSKLALEDSGTEPIIHTLNATLGQRAWEEAAIDYGDAKGRGSVKPADACACVVWKKMGPHSAFRECSWAPEALVVVVLAAAAVIAVAVGVWWARRKRVEWSELVVTRRMKEGRVVQRKQLEALARMTLLYDFEVRALDSLAWTLCSPVDGHSAGHARAEASSPASDDPARFEEQYRELRNVLLETSRLLLDPSLDPNAFAEAVGRDPATWRPAYYKKIQQANARKLQRGMSLKKELVGHVVFQAEHSHAHGASRELSSDSTKEEGSLEPIRSHRGSQERLRGGEAAEDAAPESIEERFIFFSKQVAQVQVWNEDQHSLFLQLKSGAVQEFMDTLHAACDELFQHMLSEPSGAALVAFHYPSADSHPAAPSGQPYTRASINDDDNSNGAIYPRPDAAEPAGAADADLKQSRRSLTLLTPPDTPSENPSASLRAPPRLSLSATPGPTILPGAAVIVGEEEAEISRPDSTPAAAQGMVIPRTSSGRGSLSASVDDAHIVIRRQDHPRVRAIRLNEEDWREVDLERSSSFKLFSTEALAASGGLGDVVRPVKDEEVYISQLYRRAVLLNDEFQVRVRKAVERRFKRRVEAHGAPVKTKMRMREKLLCYATETPEQEEATEELPLAAYILDPIRATIVCDGPSEMLEVAHWLVNEGLEEGLPVVRVKNKFAVPDASEYDGYRDLMICVLYTGSHELSIIGEIQIHDRRLHNLKLQMHKLYKVKRATKATMI